MPKTTLYLVLIAAAALLWIAHGLQAQTPNTAPGQSPGPSLGQPPEPVAGAETDPAAGKDRRSPQGAWDIVLAGGSVGWVIILLSVAAGALVIEHLVTIRESVLMPPGLGEEVRTMLAEGRIAPAQNRCHRDPSFLAFVLEAGLGEVGSGWPAVEKAMEDAAADQSARMFRKIEYLSVIGSIAPMLGLLGTVIGMIMAFRQVAETQGAARAADLAEGIYLALVTTVEGLVVAIPALGAFAVFRNRMDHLVAEAAYAALHTVAPLKRAQAPGTPLPAASKTPPPPPPPAGGR